MVRRSGFGRGLGALDPQRSRGEVGTPGGADGPHPPEPAPATDPLRRGGPLLALTRFGVGVLQPVLVREVGDGSMS